MAMLEKKDKTFKATCDFQLKVNGKWHYAKKGNVLYISKEDLEAFKDYVE